VIAPFRRRVALAPAMAGRTPVEKALLPPSFHPPAQEDGPALVARRIRKGFGGLHSGHGASLTRRDRTPPALIRPPGARQATAINLLSGLYPPDSGTIELAGHSIAGLRPEDITAKGVGRSFQITNLFSSLPVEENLRLAVQARHASRFALWRGAHDLADVTAETAEMIAFLGLSRLEHA